MHVLEQILKSSAPNNDAERASDDRLRVWIQRLPLRALRGKNEQPELKLEFAPITKTQGASSSVRIRLRLILIASEELRRAARQDQHQTEAALLSLMTGWCQWDGARTNLITGTLFAALMLGRTETDRLLDENTFLNFLNELPHEGWRALEVCLGLAGTLSLAGHHLETGLIRRFISSQPDQASPHDRVCAALWSSEILGRKEHLPVLRRATGENLNPSSPSLLPGLLAMSEHELPALNLDRLTETGELEHWNGAPMKGLLQEAATYAPRLLARALRKQGHLRGLGAASISSMSWNENQLSPSLWMTGDEGPLMHQITNLTRMIMTQCHSPEEIRTVCAQLSNLSLTEESEISLLTLTLDALSATGSREEVSVVSPLARQAAPTLIGWLQHTKIPGPEFHELTEAMRTGNWNTTRQAAMTATPEMLALLALRELLRQKLVMDAGSEPSWNEAWRHPINTVAWLWAIQEGPGIVNRLGAAHPPRKQHEEILAFARLIHAGSN